MPSEYKSKRRRSFGLTPERAAAISIATMLAYKHRYPV